VAEPDPVVVYLAHPVGAVDRAGVETHVRHAHRWLRWLIDLPNPAIGRIAWSVPWQPYVQVLEDVGLYRERALRDTLALLRRCDAIVALGRLTPGVTLELATAAHLGLPSVDLVALGPLPPSTEADGWWQRGPSVGVIADLVELVAKVERRRAAQGRS
jgi:hypothetical protein